MPSVYCVELFSGSSSVSKAIMKIIPPDWNFFVHSVDIHPKYNPTTRTDILTWDYKNDLAAFLEKAKKNDVVYLHASPPCTEFSRAKQRGIRDLKTADSMVKRTLEIIDYIRPDFWTIENPVGLLRTRPYMQALRSYLHTTSYCKWGKEYRKDTDIWTNVAGLHLPLCRIGQYCKNKRLYGLHLKSAQIGSDRRGVPGSGKSENVYPIPSGLMRTIFSKGMRNCFI